MSLESFSREYLLNSDDFLISRTDLKGNITYANPAFIEVSGFSWEELHGANHNIVRHPDMPKAAFANLWATLKAGREWNGLVMNRRKNGEYYWVEAHVTPYYEGNTLVGYASVRVKADSHAVDLARSVYADLAAGRSSSHELQDGRLCRRGLLGRLSRVNPSAMKFRIPAMMATAIAFIAASFAVGSQAAGTSPWAALDATSLLLLGGMSAILAYIGHRTLRSLRAPVAAAMQFNSQIAAGNLSARIPDFGRTEIGELAAMMDTMRKSLSSIATDVNRSIHGVSHAAQNIAHGNHELAARTEEQAASLQQTATSMEQITATVEQNSSNARHASQLSEHASQLVRDSGEIMHQVVRKMNGISDSSSQMGEIISLIDAIAFQTNILALNASIEAARAGEQGRGFAVVATEVRELAGRSADAAREIRKLIDHSTGEIADGASLVKAAESSIDEVIESVIKVSDIMAEISAASAEQSSGITQISQAIAQLDSVTQKNAGMVSHARQVSSDLQQQTCELTQAISIFKTHDQKVLDPALRQMLGQMDATAPYYHSPAPAQPRDTAEPLKSPRSRQTSAGDSWEAF